jgi:23S rRNA (adenine1618-N6)-methyltransferase
MHINNKHKEGYDFSILCKNTPELDEFVFINGHKNRETIDFSNSSAIQLLNKAILKTYYKIDFWEIPEGFLVPPIPGRADYIHYISDLLKESNYGIIPMGDSVKGLDVGVGANCIYPIIGSQEYNWNFIASEIDPNAIESANLIISKNPVLHNKIELRNQTNKKDILFGILPKDEKIDFTICNPPFHNSKEEAKTKAEQKAKNLSKKNEVQSLLNFKGKDNELWCEGGEDWFINKLIRESSKFDKNCFWYTTLVSKQSNLKNAYKTLSKYKASEVKTIPMGQGNKTSRILAWSFLDKDEQKSWKNERWNSQKKPIF